MKQSIGLGIVLGLGLGISSQVVRGDPPVPVSNPPPNCGSCDCAMSQAWRNTNDAGGYYVDVKVLLIRYLKLPIFGIGYIGYRRVLPICRNLA